MNIEQIVPLIEGKETLDQRSLSQIMLLLEKYPYFQAGHMLLLKAMHLTQSENYSNQLKISGGFISDKGKLFQFINSEFPIPNIQEIKPEEKKTRVPRERTEPKLPEIKEEKLTEITSTTSNIEIPEKEIPVKIEIIENEKKIKERINLEEKEIIKNEPEIITEPVIESAVEKDKIEVKKDELVKKEKTLLSEEEIVRLANENSKRKHQEIIKDFFQSTHSQPIEKKIAEPEKEIKLEVKKEEIIQKTEKEPVKIEQVKKTEPLEINKAETDKLLERKRSFERTKKLDLIEEQKEIKSESIEIIDKQEEKLDKLIDTKKEEIKVVEETEKIEETKKVEEVIKEPVIRKNLEGQKSEGGGSEVMNSIFSKIRQIKKEMNINSETAPVTIDIGPKKENIRLSKVKTTIEEKKGSGRTFKESYIGLSQEEKNKEINEDANTQKIENKEIKETENQEIKEIGITAKDLFSQHLKSQEIIEIPEKSLELPEIEEKAPVLLTVSDEDKKQEEEKILLVEKKAQIESIKKDIITEKKDAVILEQKSSTTQSNSAADALLRKIEEKKRRMHEEKEKSEELAKTEVLPLTEEVTLNENKAQLIQEPIEVIEEIKNEEFTGTDEIIGIIESEKDEDIIQKENSEIELVEIPFNKSSKLIDSFIEKAPNLEKIGLKETTIDGDISISSADEKDDFMTETMADIQIQQKNYAKAIEIYKKLILKFPEKKTYFAIQIKKAESLIK